MRNAQINILSADDSASADWLMKKIIVKNLQGQETHSAKFETLEQANAWIEEQKILKSWGKPERWVAESQIEVEGENIDNSLEMMIEPTSFGDVKLYKFAAEYTIEVVDVTAEVAAQKKVSDRAKKRAFGEALIDKISTINDSKNLSVEQVDAFMTNALISNLREHLWAGNIDTFISKLQSSDVSAFFTAEEKAAVILECQTFLTNLGG